MKFINSLTNGQGLGLKIAGANSIEDTLEFKPCDTEVEIVGDPNIIVIKIDKGVGFKLDLKAGLFLNLKQVYLDHPIHKNQDVYLFDVLKISIPSFSGLTSGGGDGEVGDPQEDVPFTKTK